MEQFNDILAKAKAQLEKQLPFVMYCKPAGHRLFTLFQKDSDSYTAKDFTETGFVFAPFDGTEYIMIPVDRSETAASDFVVSDVLSAVIPEAPENAFAEAHFEALVKKAIAAIEDGLFAKVVLSRKEITEFKGPNFTAVFFKLLHSYPAAFRYCWYHPVTGLWMGATPERLLLAEQSRFSTVALAGTQKFEGSEDVTWHQKERAEQQFVTDFITQSLGDKASGLKVSEPYTAKAGNVLHIKTDIQGTLHENTSLKQVVEILHPTPAVCGLPKDKAKPFILENEGYDREFYCGFLGELNMPSENDQMTDLYVNLRCMKLKDSTAHIYIGCGITKDSDPKKEFIETVNKSMTMKKVLL